MKKTLLEHRQELAANPECYTKDDYGRVSRTLVQHLKDVGYPRMTGGSGQAERREFIRLIFEVQGRRPFLHIEAPLPSCWNSPGRGDWDYNYIRYEWGHLLSKNQNPEEAFDVQNLCLMSARCNQVQTSMNIDELQIYGGPLELVIQRNIAARKVLFDSQQWVSLLSRLEQYTCAD